MEPWAPITITAVADANGAMTQLFPSWVSAGSGSTAAGTEVRRPAPGVLFRVSVITTDAAGGTIEIWDVAGEAEGAQNNSDTGTALSAAYVAAKVTAHKGKMLWKQNFKGDAGSRSAIFASHVPFLQGLAARYINAAGTSVELSLVVDGGYVKHTHAGY